METGTAADSRRRFLEIAERLARPILTAGAAGRLKADMPVQTALGARADRRPYSHLEAVARLLCGLAPFLEAQATGAVAPGQPAPEEARHLLNAISDPDLPDFLNFAEGAQPLVDAAFLAQALLRAPTALWDGLAPRVRQNLINALAGTRRITPHFNNWLLFPATIEAFFRSIGCAWDPVRIDYALRQVEQWSLGDGQYGDGPTFRWDYYNSYVIHPMLLDILAAVEGREKAWDRMRPAVQARARRHAAVLERLVGPGGSFPPIGRSLAYRCGAFHLLAQMALIEDLPEGLRPAQVRGALGAVIGKTLGSAGNYDENGWLRIGLSGDQPRMAESYVSTGSLYLCSTALLPLGLAPTRPFWSDPDRAWTQKRLWTWGKDVGTDKALAGDV